MKSRKPAPKSDTKAAPVSAERTALLRQREELLRQREELLKDPAVVKSMDRAKAGVMAFIDAQRPAQIAEFTKAAKAFPPGTRVQIGEGPHAVIGTVVAEKKPNPELTTLRIDVGDGRFFRQTPTNLKLLPATPAAAKPAAPAKPAPAKPAAPALDWRGPFAIYETHLNAYVSHFDGHHEVVSVCEELKDARKFATVKKAGAFLKRYADKGYGLTRAYAEIKPAPAPLPDCKFVMPKITKAVALPETDADLDAFLDEQIASLG